MDSLRWTSWLLLLPAVCASLLQAAQFSGQVRAADQIVPGATVTALQGGAKLSAFTDEGGRFTLDLTPGAWQIEVSMFEFTTTKGQITVSDAPVMRDWVLNMPKLSERGGAQAAAGTSVATPLPAAPGIGRGPRGARGEGRGGQGGGQRAGGNFPGRGNGGGGAPGAQGQPNAQGGRGPGRGAPGGPQGGFQSAAVRATPEGEQANAQQQDTQPPDLGGDADEALLVNGSMSGGLEQSSDDEARRQRAMGGRGGPAGPGGPGGSGGAVSAAQGMQMTAGMPPGMSANLTNDSLGLGGFGASAINGGFGVGAAAPGEGGGGRGGGPAGFGGGAPPGFGGGGRGGGGAGGGGGRGSGGLGQAGGGRGGAQAGRGGRGPFNGQFASFGNRRRTTPPVQGSIALTARNSAFNAAPYSLNGQTAQKPYSANNTLNLNIGGPLHIPKIVNWTRAQYTITFGTTLNKAGRSMVGTMPTDTLRGGDFSQSFNGLTSTIYDPQTKAPFPNNQIPVTRFNSASVGLLQYFPNPTYTGIVQNYRFVITDPNHSRNLGVRFNAPLNNKDRLNFNFQNQHQSSDSHQLFGFLDNAEGNGLSASVGWSHSFRPRINNNANVSFSRNSNLNSPYFAYTQNVAADLGITGTSQAPIDYGPPGLSFTNFSAMNDGTPNLSRSQTTTFTDNFTYVAKRKHNLSFGFSYNRLQQNNQNHQNARGSFSFSGLATSLLDANGQPVKGTGFDFADFLLGLPQSSSVRYGTSSNYFRSWSTSAYAQDDFRVSARLTINVGLRYEYFAPYTELGGHLANLDVSPGFTAVAVVTAGQDGPYSGDLPSSIVRSSPRNFSPRLGVAWRPFPKRNTLIRGGYSVFYSGSSYAQIANQMAAQPPFATSASLTTSLQAPLTIQNGFATSPTTLTNTYAIDPNFQIAYAQTWNVTMQHTLPHALVLDTEYIGTKGTHLGIMENPNRSNNGIANSGLQINNATSFSYQTYGANSHYHAGQVRLTRRLSRSVSANSLYTFAKGIDDASSFNGTGGTVVQYLYNRALERGLSTFDVRHNLATGFQLSSPVGVRGLLRNGGWRTRILRGWNMNGNFNATTGTPLTAHVSGNLANTGGLAGGGSLRAEATGLSIHADGHPYFNPLAFTTPVPGQFGNAGRTTIPGLFRTTVNASLNRAFRFAESRRTLTFSVNAQNVFNHVTITSVGTTVNSANYGLPTTASPTRALTLNSRFSF